MSVPLRERPHDVEERPEAVCITCVPRIRLDDGYTDGTSTTVSLTSYLRYRNLYSTRRLHS